MTDVTAPDENGSRTSARSWWRRLVQVVGGDPKDREDLVELLRDAHRSGLFDADAQAMIEGVLHVSDMRVSDIMVPRPQMAVIEHDDEIDRMVEVVVESGHSRFPVIGDSRDEVEGILLAKDLLAYFAQQPRPQFELREFLRPAVFIPESKRLNVLLKEFRMNRNHIAIVVDEYGSASGLVTIEDVLEQIVGEIDDEHDTEDDVAILRRSDTTFTVKAVTQIEDFNEHFGSAFSDEEYDTVGGMVMNAFGRMPKRNDRIRIGNFRFKVLRADGRRIHLLQVEVAPESGTPDASG
jgi:magnesium and cobalt transporter